MISIFQRTTKFAALLLFLFLFVAPGAAHAQGRLSMSVSPTIFDMTANPGQTWRSTVRIINTNPYDLTVYVDVVDFVPKGEQGVPRFLTKEESGTLPTSLAHFVTSEPSVTIPAEKTVEFPFTISLPADASPGGHFASLMISTKPNGQAGGASNVQTSQVITSLIFLRVSGDVAENSTIRSFRTSQYILSKPEATFELRIENKGNVHVQPQGEIAIYNMWGQERGVIPVNQQTLFGNVLPSSVRKYSFTWSGEWSPSDIGRYTAVATLGYGLEEKQFMFADTAFWIIPWKFLLILLVVVGGFISLMSWAIKLYVRRMLALAGVQPVQQGVAASSVVTQKAVTIPFADDARRSKKAQLARVVAPLEVGILDLRARLSKTESLKKQLITLVTFARQYWKFFVTIVAIVIFLIAIVWFISEANTKSREFEVTIEGVDQTVKVSSENSLPVETAPPTSGVEQDFTLSIINRSGDSDLLEKVSSVLERNGYAASDTSEGGGAPEERTVIVYDPKKAEAALKISKILDNALLSSFTDTSTSTPQIVIYLGSETIQKIQ